MKKIWKLLKEHFESGFDWKLHIAIAIFLAISIAINYTINLENGIIDKSFGRPVRVLWYFLLYSFGYFASSAIVFYYTQKFHYFRSRRYWLITLAAMIFLSFNLGFPYLRHVANMLTDNSYQLFRWAFGVANNLVNFFIEALPLLVFAWFFEKKRENFGVNGNNVDLRPYWQILMIVAPLVLIASFEQSFREYYPVYKRYVVTDETNPTNLPTWLFALGYELAYGMDFFNVEFLFRGVLVVGVSQVIGKEAILPMVSVYCFLHFGKPMGECISSIFGGYILGVVALYTRNIWGGVIVHIGLAWMMETMAFIQNAINE